MIGFLPPAALSGFFVDLSVVSFQSLNTVEKKTH